MKTRITELLGIEFPIIQGGLARLGYADLAAAVSNAGGLGQVTAMSLPSPAHLRKEIHKTKENTDKPFAVNFAIGRDGRKYKEFLKVAIEEGIKIVSITGANPKEILGMLKDTGIISMVLVSSVRQAQNAEKYGANMVMAVGNDGGGILGKDEIGTMVLVPRVVESVSIPVIASGGITNGKGLLAALALGAEGIEMGTRFVATKECVLAHENYQHLLVESNETDTVVIRKSIGVPTRALKSRVTEKILELEQEQVGFEGIKKYSDGEANRQAAVEGRLDKGYLAAGQGVGLIHDIPSVDELIKKMVDESKIGLARIEDCLENRNT